jgi:hypothetical protein
LRSSGNGRSASEEFGYSDFEAIPDELYADGQKDKSGEASEDVSAGCAENAHETVCVAVTDQHEKTDDGHRYESSDEVASVAGEDSRLLSHVGANGDGDGDASGADSDGKGQRVKCMLHRVFKCGRGSIRSGSWTRVFLIEEFPAGGCDDETPCYLHDKQGDAEEGEDLTAKEKRDGKDYESVDRNFFSKKFLDGLGVAPGKAKKYGSVTDGIDDREKCDECEGKDFDEAEEKVGHSTHPILTSRCTRRWRLRVPALL